MTEKVPSALQNWFLENFPKGLEPVSVKKAKTVREARDIVAKTRTLAGNNQEYSILQRNGLTTHAILVPQSQNPKGNARQRFFILGKEQPDYDRGTDCIMSGEGGSWAYGGVWLDHKWNSATDHILVEV